MSAFGLTMCALDAHDRLFDVDIADVALQILEHPDPRVLELIPIGTFRCDACHKRCTMHRSERAFVLVRHAVSTLDDVGNVTGLVCASCSHWRHYVPGWFDAHPFALMMNVDDVRRRFLALRALRAWKRFVVRVRAARTIAKAWRHHRFVIDEYLDPYSEPGMMRLQIVKRLRWK
jgi:hypothetical protein